MGRQQLSYSFKVRGRVDASRGVGRRHHANANAVREGPQLLQRLEDLEGSLGQGR